MSESLDPLLVTEEENRCISASESSLGWMLSYDWERVVVESFVIAGCGLCPSASKSLKNNMLIFSVSIVVTHKNGDLSVLVCLLP